MSDLTVGELRRALDFLPDDTPVAVQVDGFAATRASVTTFPMLWWGTKELVFVVGVKHR